VYLPTSAEIFHALHLRHGQELRRLYYTITGDSFTRLSIKFLVLKFDYLKILFSIIYLEIFNGEQLLANTVTVPLGPETP
jgi:hypothetical protein